MQAGRSREAHQHCLTILKLDRGFADAWYLCGVIAAQNGQLAKSVDILRNAVMLAPDNPEYRAELGKMLLAQREPEQALAEAHSALALAPGDLPTLNTLGTLLSHGGEHEKALACFDRVEDGLAHGEAGKRLPAQWQAEFYFNRAVALQFAGRFEDAEQSYEQAIGLKPDLFKAHSALSSLSRQTDDNNHLKRLSALRDKVSNSNDQLHLGHAIAREQENLGQYQASLSSLAWAKEAQARQIDYRATADAELFAHLKSQFSDLSAVDGCDNGEPIFIMGMPRTGTTLVQQILSSHSQVFAAGELQNFPLQVKRLSGTETPDLIDVETIAQTTLFDMNTLGEAYIESTRPRTGHTPRFIDKLPLNFLYAGLIHMALPKAKLICLRRDPMDTCLSNYRQLFASNFRYYNYNLNLLDCGRYYLEFDRLMQHWQKTMPGAIYEISYEALIEDPQRQARQLLEYCQLPWEDQCLAFHKRKTSVATPSAVQVRQGIYSSSVDRWRRYGDELLPLYELLQSAGLYS